MIKVADRQTDSKQRLLLVWTATFFPLMIAVWFVHEMAHGVGFLLEGIHVSTGFNMVGVTGLAPGHPGFDLDLPVRGLTAGVLFGPLANWLMAILFTAILVCRKGPGRSTLMIGAAAVANGVMRLVPMAIFLVAAALGKIGGLLQDEQKMSLGAIERLKLPISTGELRAIVESDPTILLGDAGFFSWTLLSAGISLICILLAFHFLFGQYRPQLQKHWRKAVFAVTPLVLYLPTFAVVSMLDRIARINW
jgi:hypothetical protein